MNKINNVGTFKSSSLMNKKIILFFFILLFYIFYIYKKIKSTQIIKLDNNYLDSKISLEDGLESISLSFHKKLNESYFSNLINIELKKEICPYFSPKEKEFSKIPLKYEHGISIIVTAYKMKKYIKEALDSISNQTWFKNNNNYEILVGVDNCYETLSYLHSIMNEYNNIRVFMMKSNKGTYITTNTLMTIAKYDNLLRFDSDDVMYPFMIEFLMNNIENFDLLRFQMQNFGNDNQTTLAYGQIMMKHEIFDLFGGFMPWPCFGDAEFILRIRNHIIIKIFDEILFKRRIHSSNLTVTKKTGEASYIRNLFRKYTFSKLKTYDSDLNNAVIFTIINKFYEVFPNTSIKIDEYKYIFEFTDKN